VAKVYRKSLIAIRKKELSRLKKTLSEKEYRVLKSAIALLCHCKEFMRDDEKKMVAPLFKYSPFY
jgi:hypothetical protein